MRTVYGPFRSWRLGRAIGIDPICRQPKVCNMKCTYCRLGSGGLMVTERSRFVDAKQVREEASELLEKENVEFLEFRGTGEPFLAKNLGEIVVLLRELTDVPFGLITNGSMLSREDVQVEMDDFDFIAIKLDASDAAGFNQVNRPHPSVSFDVIIEAVRRAIRSCEADIALQITFYRGNVANAEKIAVLVEDIGPEMVLLTTPQCPEVPGLSKKELLELKDLFHSFKVRTIFDEP